MYVMYAIRITNSITELCISTIDISQKLHVDAYNKDAYKIWRLNAGTRIEMSNAQENIRVQS